MPCAASMLCDALEKLAGARGATKLMVDASDTAIDFFRKRGYVALAKFLECHLLVVIGGRHSNLQQIE